jgi:hypothetical protein
MIVQCEQRVTFHYGSGMTDKHHKRYAMQRNKARHRGIEWNLTFDEWFGWWLENGHYHERGRRKGEYVMARFGDVGPYSLDNIYCIPNRENMYNHDMTHCLKGHSFTEDNTYYPKNGTRQCRICMRIKDAKSKRRRGLTKRPMDAYKPRSTTVSVTIIQELTSEFD